MKPYPHVHTLRTNEERCTVCGRTLTQLVHVMLYGHYRTTRFGTWLCARLDSILDLRVR